MSEEWGPWIEHDASPCPIAVGMRCEVTCRNRDGSEPTKAGVITPKSKASPSWTVRDHLEMWNQVIRYRVLRPRALLNLIEMVENLPAPSRQKEEA